MHRRGGDPAGGNVTFMALLLHPGSKWVLIGDSITDCGRTQPVGEGLFGALGTGYVSMVDALIAAAHPEARLRLVNMGMSGNTIRDLKNRWDRDVIDQAPEWLSVMIGINDVWRQFDSPRQSEWSVDPEEYGATFDELLLRTKGSLRGLVLATPFYIEASKDDAMRKRMDEYGAIVKRLAVKHGAILVDMQAAFDRVLAHTYPAHLAWDRVHPTATGTAIIARAFLDAVGFEWSSP
jgi:lysophospholipase L1-like esterase